MFSVSVVVLFYLAGLVLLLIDNAESYEPADGPRR